MKNYQSWDTPVKSRPVSDLRIYGEANNKANNITYFNLEVQNL